jgi:hypothetical protein
MQSSLRETIERKRRARAACPPDRFDDRGIVICAGGVRYFTCAFVLIRVLRHLGVTLPIQVWHLGQREMSAEMRRLLVAEGVEVVDAETVLARHPARLAGGWPLKPYAILHSRFREVLYLDADTVPLTDPQRAFAWDAFGSSGLLLWPDAVDIKASNPVWAHLGLPPSERASVDSGVLLADKARAWDVLDLALALNEHSDELYRLIHGDKDSFLLAAMLLERSFGFIPHRPFAFEWDRVQRDEDGDPFLHHRCGSKWALNLPNRPVSDPGLMPACEAALAALRARWSGIVFHPPRRSARAQAEEARLIALQRAVLQTSDAPPRTLELLPGNVVGAGRAREQHWAVVDDGDRLQLCFYRDHEPIAALAPQGDGRWSGRGCDPGSDISLTERRDGAAIDSTEDARLLRSAAEPLAALLRPDWFAAGYDQPLAEAIGSALGLLNDGFDDCPERLMQFVETAPPSAAWRRYLAGLTEDLARRRDARLAMVRPSSEPKAQALDPQQYGKPALRDAV